VAAAHLAMEIARNRRRCRNMIMSDNLALSDISSLRRSAVPTAFDRLKRQAIPPRRKGHGSPEALLSRLAIFLHRPVGLPNGLAA
jgi:hypothetical protein